MWIYGVGGVSVAYFLLVILFPRLVRARVAPDRTEAISNAKQIGLCLYEFEDEYGRYPDGSTRARVKADTATLLTLGDHSSNALFRQLIANGAKTEKIFWAKTATTSRRPDNIFTSDATALASGECAFSYIAGLSSTDDPGTPIVVCPLIPGTTRFDPKPFGGKAIILRVDSSARFEPIDRSGHVMIRGMDLFDPRQPFWKGKMPDIKWPE